jgi:CheY-like chemotaxis protein
MPIKSEAQALWAERRSIVFTPPGGIFDYQSLEKSFIFAASSPDDKRKGPALDSKLAQKRIMVVDDETQIAKLYSLILSNLGFTVSDLEYDGAAAVDRISKDRDVDLLIIDQRMPEMDGTSATRRIKEINPDIKAIMVTAYEIPDSDREMFDAILTKPISSKSLVDVVTKVLSA